MTSQKLSLKEREGHGVVPFNEGRLSRDKLDQYPLYISDSWEEKKKE